MLWKDKLSSSKLRAADALSLRRTQCIQKKIENPGTGRHWKVSARSRASFREFIQIQRRPQVSRQSLFVTGTHFGQNILKRTYWVSRKPIFTFRMNQIDNPILIVNFHCDKSLCGQDGLEKAKRGGILNLFAMNNWVRTGAEQMKESWESAQCTKIVRFL